MNTIYLTCGAILICVCMFKSVEGWKDGQKWRQRRIAHVFGKRNGGTSNAAYSPVSLAQNDALALLDVDDKDSEEYDQPYFPGLDHISQTVIDRLAYLELLRSLRPPTTDLLDYLDDAKSSLEYPPEH